MSVTDSIPQTVIDEVIALRRDFHAHPELGFQEHRTAGIVAERLRGLGLEVHTGIAKTGVVGVVRGTKPGKTIMLRADMDALPIDEENDAPYRSTHGGRMHACGHDGHVAILLGAAQLIAAQSGEHSGTVVLCFQPAEEGLGGAKAMVEEGLVERFGIERAYGLHLYSEEDTGIVGVRAGDFYASSDSIEITIHGRGGHGASPHLSVDPIYVAASFVVAVQQIVARQIDPIQPAVITIGALHAGTTHNVIPGSAKLLGTVRAFEPAVREAMEARIERVLKAVCDAAGATYEYRYLWRYPVTSNDARQSAFVRSVAERRLGAARVVDAERLMGAEDFSFFAQRVPACYFTLGSRCGESTGIPHHNSRFDIDERALETGVAMMLELARSAPLEAP